MGYQQYGSNPWMPEMHQQQPQLQPSVFVPQVPTQMQVPSQPGAQGGSLLPGVDPFVAGVASNVFANQGHSYLQRSQAYVQSKMGFLSGGMVQYLFDVTPEYVRGKLALLLMPFVTKWSFARQPEQLSGGHKFLSPRRDVNAPDLYVPLMALWTYCMLIGIALFGRSAFRPEAVYSTVSSAAVSWTVHSLLLKAVLWIVGVPSAAPLLELVAYAGYSFVAACTVLAVRLILGRVAYHVTWVYASLAMGVFMVRTMKRVLLQEAQDYRALKHNYLLLGLATFQFPFLAWMSQMPRA